MTDYRYNTLNQVVAQHSPDGGASSFWVTRQAGKINCFPKCNKKDSTQYSFTKYDDIGRITEVGQLTSSTGTNDTTSRDQQSLKTWLTNAGRYGGADHPNDRYDVCFLWNGARIRCKEFTEPGSSDSPVQYGQRSEQHYVRYR